MHSVHILHFQLESNSLILVNIMNDLISCPWSLQHLFEEIYKSRQYFVSVSPYCRQATKPPNILSNVEIDSNHNQVFSNFASFPKEVRVLFERTNLDFLHFAFPNPTFFIVLCFSIDTA